MTTGQRIKEARKRANMTQAELARKLSIPFQSVSQWERDVRNPKYETLQNIAEALDVTVGYLIGHDHINTKQFFDAFRKNDIKTVERLSGLPEGSLLSRLTPEEIVELGQASTQMLNDIAPFWECKYQPDEKREGIIELDVESLIDCFSLLNEEGRRVALERVQELTEIPKYQKPQEK